MKTKINSKLINKVNEKIFNPLDKNGFRSVKKTELSEIISTYDIKKYLKLNILVNNETTLEILYLILMFGGGKNSKKKIRDFTYLVFKDLLEKRNLNINTELLFNNYPLMFNLVMFNSIDLLNLFIKYGINLNIIEKKYKNNIFHFLFYEGHEYDENFLLTLIKNVDKKLLNSQNKEKLTPLSIAETNLSKKNVKFLIKHDFK